MCRPSDEYEGDVPALEAEYDDNDISVLEAEWHDVLTFKLPDGSKVESCSFNEPYYFPLHPVCLGLIRRVIDFNNALGNQSDNSGKPTSLAMLFKILRRRLLDAGNPQGIRRADYPGPSNPPYAVLLEPHLYYMPFGGSRDLPWPDAPDSPTDFTVRIDFAIIPTTV